KELIKNTSLTQEEIEKLTPEEIAQLGMSWEQIGSSVLVRRTDVRQDIKNLIASWKQFAGSLIEEKPATDGTLDRTAAAKVVLKRLHNVENSLAGGDLYRAIYESLLLGTNIHQLGIIDNESAIAAGEESIKGARRGGRLRSAKIRIRNREMAQ